MKTKLLQNLRDLIQQAFEYQKTDPCFVLYDSRHALSSLLAEAYQEILGKENAWDFDANKPESIFEKIHALPPQSLVVLIQSSSFRLNEFRFRIELFKRGLKVLEHAHLERIQEEEFSAYVDSLAYDPSYYRNLGRALKTKIDHCRKIKLLGNKGSELFYDSPFEDAKLNVGDYRNMKNYGGQFPIGEVFSEPKDLARVNGSLEIFAYGDSNFRVHAPPENFRLLLKEGRILEAVGAPPDFLEILNEIKKIEKEVWVRELGFGLNRAFSKERRVSDIGTYERMCGIHLSIGAKHALYTKEGFPKKQCKFHVDAFADVKKAFIDEEVVFESEKYII